LTAGQSHDVKMAPVLLQGCEAKHVIADKAYDSDKLIELIVEQSAVAVIPPTSNRTEPRPYDRERYKDRNLVERFFNLIKRFRAVATRYEKTARNFFADVIIASMLLWL